MVILALITYTFTNPNIISYSNNQFYKPVLDYDSTHNSNHNNRKVSEICIFHDFSILNKIYFIRCNKKKMIRLKKLCLIHLYHYQKKNYNIL